MIKKLKDMIFQMVAGANVVTVIIMLLIGYSDRITPTSSSIIVNAGLAYPVFLIINLLFLVFWVIVKIRWVVIPLLGFVFGYLPTRTYCPLNFGQDTTQANLKVLSYNVWMYGNDQEYEGENPIVKYIAEQNADIVCLQEAVPNFKKKQDIEKYLFPIYPYYVDSLKRSPTSSVLAIYSKHPIIKTEIIDFVSETNMAAAAWINIKGDPTIVINAHLETTSMKPDDKAGFKHLVKGDYAADSAENTSRRIYSKLKEATIKRAPQAEAIARFIAQHSDKPMICCGDFNDGPNSYAHYTIADKLTDCYISSGNGPGISYHRSGFYVRIDNMFCSNQFEPLKCLVDNKIATSDHYPIICWLKKR